MRGREERGRKPERRKINISSFFSLAVHGSEERMTTACGLMLIVYSYKIRDVQYTCVQSSDDLYVFPGNTYFRRQMMQVVL